MSANCCFAMVVIAVVAVVVVRLELLPLSKWFIRQACSSRSADLKPIDTNRRELNDLIKSSSSRPKRRLKWIVRRAEPDSINEEVSLASIEPSRCLEAKQDKRRSSSDAQGKQKQTFFIAHCCLLPKVASSTRLNWRLFSLQLMRLKLGLQLSIKR